MRTRASIPKVRFFYLEQRFAFSRRTQIKSIIETVFRKEGFKLGSLSYIFCSDEYLLDINKQYLKHDYYTDIITFDLSAIRGIVDGEVYISVDRVRDNAVTLKVPFSSELRRVLVHGALHLCGYKDKTKTDAQKMRDREDYWLARMKSST